MLHLTNLSSATQFQINIPSITKSTIVTKGCLKPYFYEKHFVRENAADIASCGNYLTSLENPKTDSIVLIFVGAKEPRQVNF